MTFVRSMRLLLAAGAMASWVVLAACGEDPIAPEPQVIEETVFDSSLNIDLSTMQMLPNGVYREDLEAGTGDTLVYGVAAESQYKGWLSDGTLFGQGPLPFRLGIDPLISGFEDGVLGMLEGGTRRIIIPPALGYDNSPPRNSVIPQGAILIFEVVLDSVTPLPGA